MKLHIVLGLIFLVLILNIVLSIHIIIDYKYCQKLTKETGIKYEYDGEYCCPEKLPGLLSICVDPSEDKQ